MNVRSHENSYGRLRRLSSFVIVLVIVIIVIIVALLGRKDAELGRNVHSGPDDLSADSRVASASTLSYEVLAGQRTLDDERYSRAVFADRSLRRSPASHLPSRISWILTYVPVRKPNTPKEMMVIFFHSRQFHLPRPFSCSQTVTSSITDGNISPNVDKHTAPTREMNGPKFGIAIATQTVKITSRIRRRYSPSSRREPKYCLAFFQMISMGT